MNNVVFSTIVYVSGGVKYSVPEDLAFTYLLTLLRFTFVGFLICWYLSMPYTVVIMAISVLLADYRFYQDFSNSVEAYAEDEEEEDELDDE